MKKNYLMEGYGLDDGILRNLRKDLLVEFRNRFGLTISVSFAVIVTVAVSLTAGGAPFPALVQSLLLWIVLFFSAMNGLSHIFVREEDQSTALYLRITISADAIFISKFIYNQIFVIIILAVVTPLFVFFLQMNVNHVIHFMFSIVAGGIAIAAATTILAAIVAKAGGKGSLLTLLSFPVLLPVLWTSIFATKNSLDAVKPQNYDSLFFLLAFSGFISAISFLLFRFVWIED
jgi:heme exporter protein B